MIWPSEGDKNVCYALHPFSAYCYPLANQFEALAGEHFNVSGLISEAVDHAGTQVFGVAFDDVVRLRVQVGGEWTSVPQHGNGFYLALPGVEWNQLGLFEATLEDGTVQLHDMQKNRRVS